MPEALADDHDVDAGGEHEGRLAVAQVVQPNPAQADLRGELGEPVGEPIGKERDAVGAGEDQVVVVVGVSELSPDDVLSEPVGEKDTDGVRVEVDDAVLAARGLGTSEGDAAVVGAALVARSREAADEQDDLLADVEAALLQVDVGPPQSDRLTATQPRGGEQVEGRTELVAVGVVEEPAELLRFPWTHVRPGHRGQRDADGGVVRDESKPHGGSQRGAQRGMHAAQAGRLHGPVGLDRPQCDFDMLRPQLAKTEVSDAGDEVVVEVSGVAGGGGGPESVGDPAGQPVGEERGDGHVVHGDRETAGAGVEHLGEGLFGVLLGREPEASDLAAFDVHAVRAEAGAEVDGVAPGPVLDGAGLPAATGVEFRRA